MNNKDKISVRKSKKNIFVTGDFVLDHHIYEGQRHHFGDNASNGVRVKTQLGGAVLVNEMLLSLIDKEAWESVCAADTNNLSNAINQFNPSEQAYAFWRPFPANNTPVEKQFWRVSEAMGFGHDDNNQSCTKFPQNKEIPKNPHIAVISDGGMDFRQCEANWQKGILGKAKWVVFKTSSPVAAGLLWKHLSSECRDKLIVVVDAHHLRKSQARMPAGLSWEGTIESLIRELSPGGALQALTRCRHLMVTFGSEGAVWIDFSGEKIDKKIHFVFDSHTIEGEHANEIDGGCFGFLSCVTASTVWQITLNEGSPDFAAALEGGLSAMRDLREKGHGPAGEAPSGFPAKRLAEVIRHPTFRYSRSSFGFRDVMSEPDCCSWSILRQSQRNDGPAFGLARLLLLRGIVALENLPHLKVGKLLTADRREIEAYRTLIHSIRMYWKTDSGKKPLSLGIFGPPGAGKSFAVKELAETNVGKDGWIEFNLSQFNTPDDLIGAFHQIRDQVLQGRHPVAFFDEFDSQEYRWLQYLLAPMQDGKFQEGQLTHTLGKCIFIFAGGTSRTFETFGPPAPDGNEKEVSDACRKFMFAKGPDFKSRLDGYLNVVGLNKRQILAEKGYKGKSETAGGYCFKEERDDILFPVRRALMIRAELKCAPHDKLDMDEGLVNALLCVDVYSHGARSLGKIIQPFVAHRTETLHRSLLLPPEQLKMNTNAEQFIELCGNVRAGMPAVSLLTEDELEVMASSIHETWRELSRKQGELKNEDDIPFDKLSDFKKNSNRAAARRIPETLAIVDLRLAKRKKGADASNADDSSVRQYIEQHLEILADAEHEGWMNWHLEQGWQYNPKRDNDKRRHNCLVQFSELKDSDKNKDREQVRHYPDFAKRAGMKIVFGKEKNKT